MGLGENPGRIGAGIGGGLRPAGPVAETAAVELHALESTDPVGDVEVEVVDAQGIALPREAAEGDEGQQ